MIQFPHKRAVATVLYTDVAGRVVVVEPVYKPGWELPGGAVEPDESPWQAARREIAEELNLQLSACRLLVLDYSPARPGRIDGLVAVFDGGVLNEAEIAQIRQPADELSSYAFVQASELGNVLLPTWSVGHRPPSAPEQQAPASTSMTATESPRADLQAPACSRCTVHA